MLKRFWRWLSAPHARLALGTLVVAGGVGAILLWGGFHTVLEMTHSEAFCISCHEMQDTVYKEYTASIHYKNASGVRATCPDCHVPKPLAPMVMGELAAASELYHSMVGTIDTPEKFEANRLPMARRVWEKMIASDSRECHNCHSFDAMDFHKQKPEAVDRMQKGMKAGETCVSCHKGVAHKMPDMAQGYRAMLKEITAKAGQKVDKGDVVLTLRTTPLFIDTDKAAPDAAGDGKFLSASQSTVLDRKGDWVKVRIDGWQQQGAERVIYALKGQRIITAALNPELMEKVKSETGVEDPDTGLIWSKVSLEAWTSKMSLVADQASLWAYGAEMYRSACGTCHNLAPPGNTLANQWAGTLNAMKRFISLDDEEYRFLQKYLQLNAKDTGGKQNG